MAFEPVDRLPVIESYWWWDQTLTRWYEEGLPRTLTGHTEIAAYLGLDTHRIFWLTPLANFKPPPGRNRDNGYIHTMDEYERLVRPIFKAPLFDQAEIERLAAEQDRGDVFLWLQIDGFFWFPRELLGIERHLYAFHDQPELINRMNADLVEYTGRLLDELARICVPDVISFAEDMSYNKGPMISKTCFEVFIAPHYQQLLPTIEAMGAIPIMDSDGNVADMIPWLKHAGIMGISPLERRAGNDIGEIRRQHPKFRMLGAFDKTVMHLEERAVREEFERILPVMQSGGYVPSVDHQTPPEVSLADYHRYIALLREYCEKAATESMS